MKSGKSTLLKTGRKTTLAAAALLLASWSLLSAGCKKDDGGSGQADVTPTLQLLADNLTAPVTMMEAPDDSHRLFVVDEVGKIWVILSDGRRLAQPFLDLSAAIVPLQPNYDERGLLGLAFHPNFRNNGKFYVFYTVPSSGGGPAVGYSWNNVSRISEFTVSAANSNLADPRTERIILEENHPQLNHNGGTLAFGPDGYLYISIGDGGNKDDVGAGHANDWYAANAGGNAQNLSANLLGKVLRIDVNSGNPYSIPADNPFVTTGSARGEIYAFGFRNPYRFSFDQGGNHDLYLGDAGQSLYEEIDLVTPGGNYGWNVKEGTACFSTDNDLTVRPGCPTSDPYGNPLIDPIIQLNNAANPAGGVATVIVGGYVYRGSTFPQLQGSYIFGSFSQAGAADGKVYVAAPSSAAGLRNYMSLNMHNFEANVGAYIKGFGQDLSGEIYVLTSDVAGPSGSSGKVYKLVAAQ
jgi:glucose/arabinose dehydrogenase